MKLMSLTVPILIVSMTVIAVWGMGMLAVKTSAFSTQTSLDLLRLHLRVARLHEELLQHSRQALTAHAAKVAADGGPAALRHLGETPEAPAAETDGESGDLRPWPGAEAAPKGTAPTALEEGLRTAQPALNRLAAQLDQAVPRR